MAEKTPVDATFELPPYVNRALGRSRSEQITALATAVTQLRAVAEDANTIEVISMPMRRDAARRWQYESLKRHEDWVFLISEDGQRVLAVDEPSEAGKRDPAAAIIYPEIHMRLVSWWLIHAWRSHELIDDALSSLSRWRISTGAALARAIIEEAGCLHYESTLLGKAWTDAKGTKNDPLGRPAAVRNLMAPVLDMAAFGSRMKFSHPDLQATNVVTYVSKLAKAVNVDDLVETYDWLSDAAHPAFAARITYASPPIMDDRRAIAIRFYARSPIGEVSARGGERQLEATVALHAADALILCGNLAIDLLDQALSLVDDFGLTTGAASLTNRDYWRKLRPTRGSRPCACGRRKWSDCGHWWNAPAPTISPARSHIPGKRTG